jgi:PAS domain S-box-containing protein
MMDTSVHRKFREPDLVELIGMFSQAPIGFCCFDRNLQFTFINNCLAQINGMSVEEHLGRSIHEIIPDVAAGVEAQLRQVIETGEPLVGGAVDAETPAHPGLIRSFQHHYYAVKSEAGEVLAVACVVQDVTARKQTEEALDRARGELERRVEERTRELSQANRELEREIGARVQAQDFFGTLLHAAPDPIITVGRDGKIIVANRQVAIVFGYSSEELIGQSVDILLPEHLRGRHVHHRNDYFGDPQVRPMGAVLNLYALRKDGRKVPVEISLSPVQTTEDTFVTAVIRDVTERKQAGESLQDLNARLITAQEEERSRIARELHDDFSQRLALLAVDLERLHNAPPESQEHLVDDLASLLQRTKEISSGLHRLSHRLHPSILEHIGLVAAARSFCKEISDQHGIHIEFVHHGVPHSLPGDVALCVYRVAQEALRNVIKHSGAESARVEIIKTASELKLQISDSGTGFDPKIARTSRGLGLLSMRERLRQVDGTISFMRIEPTGTRIDVRIPVRDSNQP